MAELKKTQEITGGVVPGAAGNTAAAGATAAAQEPLVKAQSNNVVSAMRPEYANGATNLYGVSQNTQQGLKQYGGAYQQSDNVTNAQNLMTQMQGNMQSAYNGMSPYMQQLQQLNQQILNGDKAFKYDINGDMLYQAYRDQYMRNGKQAMQDSIGSAAALTGGYGNSYAANVGNQAYQQWLGGLNDKLMDTYDRAYRRWGDQLGMEQAAAQGNLDAQRQLYNDSMNGMNANANIYNSLFGNEFGVHNAAQNYYLQLAGQENGSAMNDRNYYYQLAMQEIAMGKTPSQSVMQAAGLTDKDVKKLVAGNTPAAGGSGGGGTKKNDANTVGLMGALGFADGYNQYLQGLLNNRDRINVT